MARDSSSGTPALRPLLPATSAPRVSPKPANNAFTMAKKRRAIPMACDRCRARKTKCDGLRPSCGPCSKKKSAICHYESDGTETHAAALKRKLGELQQLQQQETVHKQVLDLIRTRPREEAQQIFEMIRQGEEVQTIIRHVKDAETLLQMSGLVTALACACAYSYSY